MSPGRDGEQQSLKDARTQIWAQLDAWLAYDEVGDRPKQQENKNARSES
jgi:hypothetical protein